MTNCPECGAELDFDEVDVGVGTIRGNPGCPDCHWTPTTSNDEDLVEVADVVMVDGCVPVSAAIASELVSSGILRCRQRRDDEGTPLFDQMEGAEHL